MTTYVLLALTDDGGIRLAPVNGSYAVGFWPRPELEPVATAEHFAAFETSGWSIEIDTHRTELPEESSNG